MRSGLKWVALMASTPLLVTACSQDAGSDGSSSGQGPADVPVATTECASKGELTMWERSGGNKQMVDQLVAAWNAKNPDCAIKLTYIPHTEMVGKIAGNRVR
jgi:multiple sugar transport system substrate-binding protein